MRSPVFAARLWTRLYTWRMDPTVGAARRAEIESDLWAFERDEALRSRLSPSLHVWIRLLSGIPDDLGWRIDHDDLREQLLHSRFVVTASVALVVAALWALPWFGQAPLSGRMAVFDCARAAAPPQSADELRLQVVTCAGAFFRPE